MEHFQNIQRLIESYDKILSREVINHLLDYLDHIEPGLAIEEFCTQIYEKDIPISKEDYNLIERIAISMSMQEDSFIFLKAVIKD